MQRGGTDILVCIVRVSPSIATTNNYELLALANIAASVGHLAFGATSIATPVVYIGQPAIVLTGIGLIAIRGSAGCCGWDLQGVTSQYGYLLAALCAMALAAICQNPETLSACDARGPWYVHTHGFWHVAMALALLAVWLFFWTEDFATVDRAHGTGGAMEEVFKVDCDDIVHSHDIVGGQAQAPAAVRVAGEQGGECAAIEQGVRGCGCGPHVGP